MRLTAVLAAISFIALLLGLAFAAADDGYFENADIQAKIEVNNLNLKYASSPATAIPINLSQPISYRFEYKVLSPDNLYITHFDLTIYFADIAIYTHSIPYEWPGLLIPAGISDAVEGEIDLRQYLQLAGLQLATGIYRVSANIYYHHEGQTQELAIGTDYPSSSPVYFHILGNPLTSVAGIVAGVGAAGAAISTASTIVGFIGTGSAVAQVSQLANLGSGNPGDWLELVKTANRLRVIRKKAKDLLALPNLTVITASPSLFDIIAAAATGSTAAAAAAGAAMLAAGGRDDRRAQLHKEVRERATTAWAGVRCPKCNSLWRQEGPCPKCNLDWEEGRRLFADQIVKLADKAIPILAKKKNIDIHSLAKKLKTNDYYAGMVGTILTDVQAVEIAKVKTPVRSFAINGASIALVALTWTQLLGLYATGFIGWIAIVSTGLTISFFIALLVSRIAQGKRIRQLQQRYTKRPETQEPEEPPEQDEPVPKESPTGDAP